MPQALKQSRARAGRRGNNEGSIYQDSKGRWVGAVTIGYTTDGAQIRKVKYGKTRQEAAKKITKLVDEVLENGYRNILADKERNFEILCREWFDLFIASNISTRTGEARRTTLKNHIFPAFGKFNVQDITDKMLQRFFNGKVKQYASDTVHKMKNLLNNFFVYAVDENYVAANPMSKVKVRKYEKVAVDEDDTGKALKPEVRKALLGFVEANPIFKPILITSSNTGLRPQEICGLRWVDVDFTKRTISVKRAVVRETEFDEDWNIIKRWSVIGKTKTPMSVRRISIPAVVVGVLLEWQVYCKDNDIASDYVFPNTKTGGFRQYSGLRSTLEQFKKKHGLINEGITLYTFRHTFASILLEEGVNQKYAAEVMGHKKLSTFLDYYCHVASDNVHEQAAQTMDRVHERLTQRKSPASSEQLTGLT
ncbi:MAG: tyrosine-type recombinase/integrase [Defluviitaleaceae bacterium]|nr:tyrosine-type recombinase/integrase [Defluviitaleaceae bacterium]